MHGYVSSYYAGRDAQDQDDEDEHGKVDSGGFLCREHQLAHEGLMN